MRGRRSPVAVERRKPSCDEGVIRRRKTRTPHSFGGKCDLLLGKKKALSKGRRRKGSALTFVREGEKRKSTGHYLLLPRGDNIVAAVQKRKVERKERGSPSSHKRGRPARGRKGCS